MKICIDCGIEKDSSEFYTGINQCRNCKKDYRAKWYSTNREATLKQRKGYRLENRDAILAQKRDAWPGYYDKHHDQILASAAIYRLNNKEAIRERIKDWELRNPEKLIEKSEKYRARKFNLFVEDVDRRVVFERDHGICYLCEESVDPENWHLDHKIPISRGGPHSYANVAVTHPRCNQQKNTKKPEEFMQCS